MTGKKRSRVVLIGLFFGVEFKFKVLYIEVFLIRLVPFCDCVMHKNPRPTWA